MPSGANEGVLLFVVEIVETLEVVESAPAGLVEIVDSALRQSKKAYNVLRMVFRYEDLKVVDVIQGFIDLVHEFTSVWPQEERFGLISQVRRGSCVRSSQYR